jgi:hypothetical protein
MATTNSSRVVMLIRLIIGPADESRLGSNQMEPTTQLPAAFLGEATRLAS